MTVAGCGLMGLLFGWWCTPLTIVRPRLIAISFVLFALAATTAEIVLLVGSKAAVCGFWLGCGAALSLHGALRMWIAGRIGHYERRKS